MKKKLILSFLCGTTMLASMTSCSNDEYVGQDIPGGKLQVFGSIQKQQSRATGTQWDNGDAIGIHDGTLSRNVNVKYLASESGKFTAAGNDIYVLGSDEMTFNAYYPYANEVTSENTAINFDAALGDNVDFMWAQTKASRENPNASFLFAHKMSKMSIAVKDVVADGNDMTVTLNGVVTNGSFETTTGVVTPGNSTTTITASGTVGSNVYFILPPAASSSSVSISIFVDGKNYQGTFDPVLPAGTQMNYTVDLGTTDERNTITVSSGTITDWTTEDGGEIIVVEKELENVLEVGDFYLTDGTVIDYRKTLTAEQKAMVAGVVFYVGNAQPSVLYSGTYDAANDLLLKDHADCTHGLVLGAAYPAKGAHFLDVELAGGAGLMSAWMMENSIAGIYGARYQYIDGSVSESKANSNGENHFLGYNNTQLWKQFAQAKGITTTGEEDFVALAQLDEFAAANPIPAETSGWYIPSLAEMKALVPLVDADTKTYDVEPAIAASFAKLGDDTFLQKSRYWTSTEGRVSKEKAQTMALTAWKNDAWTQSFSPTNNNSTGWFHFVFAF